VPATAKQIKRAAIATCSAEAAIAHLHVRNPATGKPCGELALYRAVVECIRDASSPVIINLMGVELIPPDVARAMLTLRGKGSLVRPD
jgi:uncharacterized protein (DUF849 family)